jgi:hypothetical protein
VTLTSEFERMSEASQRRWNVVDTLSDQQRVHLLHDLVLLLDRGQSLTTFALNELLMAALLERVEGEAP